MIDEAGTSMAALVVAIGEFMEGRSTSLILRPDSCIKG